MSNLGIYLGTIGERLRKSNYNKPNFGEMLRYNQIWSGIARTSIDAIPTGELSH